MDFEAANPFPLALDLSANASSVLSPKFVS